MWKRSVLRMFSPVLLATLLTGAVQAQDPNLIGWWTFDEGTGTIAHDASGHGYDGTVTDALWEEGIHGGALNFDAVGYVDVPPAAWATISKQVTVAFWAYGDPAIQPQAHVTFGAYIDPADNNARVASCHVPWSDGTVYWDTSGTTGVWSPDRISKAANPTEYEGQWRHWTFVKNVNTGAQSIYLNGVLWHRMTSMTQLMAGNKVTGFTIGDRPAHDSPYGGMIDDFRLYNRALTDAEIKKLALRPKAYGPTPADGAQGVASPILQWTRGDTAIWHDVFLGTTPELGPADKKARQPQMVTMYYHFAGLEPGTTYYWRIDEVEAGGTVHTGDVWTFTMAPVTAFSPNPRNGDNWIDPNTDLSWQPGQGAMTHKLYFGTDQAAVVARDASASKGSLNAASFELPTLAKETTYYWVVDEIGLTTEYPGTVWKFTTAGSGGGGVKAEYFRNVTVTGAPFLTQIEPEVNHNWGDPGGPAAGVTDNFSARWTADLEIAIADTYTFITTSDDGARLWLNDQMIVDTWVDQGTTDHSSKPQNLEPGIYSLVMEYYEAGGGAVAQLSWQSPNFARQIIPAGPLQPPVRAKTINPKDNDVNVPQDVTLIWSAGEKAVTHDVYFGDDEAAVAAATPADAGIYKGSQALEDNTWTPGALEWGKTYYWRVDEVNAASADSPWKGAVWSFTTADFLVVDDFESYTDEVEGRIFQTWIDGWGFTEPAPGDPGNGTGATVGYIDPPFAEHTIVHGGGSSMPLGYNNADSPNYSETERTFASPQNWTVNGVNTLSLAVRGYAQVTSVAVTETGGKMSLTGSGADIWGASDQFTYAYKSLSGDATIVAKVTSIGAGSNTWAKGGVMIRDSLDGRSASAQMVLSANTDGTAGNGAAFQNRATAGLDMSANDATSNTTSTSVIAPPYWVKLERIGDTFNAYTSPDGSAWTMLGTADVVMSGPVYIGICVTSHAPGEQRTFQFESIKTTGSVTGAWQGAAIDSPRYNSAQDLYVAIQDSTNKIAVVKDATAVNSATWVEVQMPLSSFTGVGMTKVKKIFIGVGDRSNPVADGTGMLFIDDIRVIKP